MGDNFWQRVNKLGEQDSEPDGIQISSAEGKLTILDFIEDAEDNNSNASDESFKDDNGYQKEFDDQLKQEQKFMKTLAKEEEVSEQQEVQGDHICHEEQKDHFYQQPGRNTNELDNEMDTDSNHKYKHLYDDNQDENVPTPGPDSPDNTETMSINAELEDNTPNDLKTKLDGPYWTLALGHAKLIYRITGTFPPRFIPISIWHGNFLKSGNFLFFARKFSQIRKFPLFFYFFFILFLFFYYYSRKKNWRWLLIK